MDVRAARVTDLDEVEALLRQANLPLAGVSDVFDRFMVVEDGGRVVAAVGLERYGRVGLLRSAVVDPAYRGRGVGGKLLERLLEDLRRDGLRSVFLLTTTAADYFPRFGFRPMERSEIPKAVQQSVEFRGACPASAAAMRMDLEES